LTELFEQPLLNMDTITPDQITTLFSPVLHTIQLISENLLVKLETKHKLHKEDGKNKIRSGFGRIFMELMEDEFASSYTKYIESFDESQITYQTLMKENIQFSKFIKKTEKNSECLFHTIQDFLITVVQRIPQYITLLRDLLKTTDDLKEYSKLNEAIENMKSIADSINEQKKKERKQI